MTRISDRQSIRQESTFPQDPNPSLHDKIVSWLDAHDTELINAFYPDASQVISDTGRETLSRLVDDARAQAIRAEKESASDTTDWHRKSYQQMASQLRKWISAAEGFPEGESTHDPELIDTTWEYKLTKGTGKYLTVAGFIDLAFGVRVCRVGIEWGVQRDAYDASNQFGKEGPSWAHWHSRKQLNFEAKSAITDLGSVIRQVRYYQTFLDENSQQFVIACPEIQWAATLVKQGIAFVEYKPDASDIRQLIYREKS